MDITAFGSESAIIMSFQGKKIIFYDETKPDTHNRFSILHELGHEINGHDFSKKDEDTYHRYEVETNYFAAQLLMPEQILRECQNRGARINRFFLQTNFGVSAQAADKRIETLARTNVEWRSRAKKEFDDIILIKYADFLNRICPIRNTYNFEDEYIRQQERNSWFLLWTMIKREAGDILIVFYHKNKMHSVNCGNNLQSALVSDASILLLKYKILCHIHTKNSSFFDICSRKFEKTTKSKEWRA